MKFTGALIYTPLGGESTCGFGSWEGRLAALVRVQPKLGRQAMVGCTAIRKKFELRW